MKLYPNKSKTKIIEMEMNIIKNQYGLILSWIKNLANPFQTAWGRQALVVSR
jgi:hypothetical protein